MINLDQAASIAKDFLTRTCGYGYSYELQEVSPRDDKWVIIYESRPFITVGTPTPTLYTVEVDKGSGEILGFKRGS